MSRRRAIKFAVAGAVLAGCALFVQQAFFSPIRYAGDGTYKYASGPPGQPFQMWAYDVSMPEFDLSEPHQAEYRFKLIGYISEVSDVALAIPEGDQDLRSHSGDFGGQLELSVLDPRGQEVMHVRGRLGAFDWQVWADRLNRLQKRPSSSFMPKSNVEYRVRISYTPDPRLAGRKGFVHLLTHSLPGL